MAKLIGVFVVIFFFGALYFLPSIVARKRKKNNFLAIFVLNFFLGWTVWGWVGALVWACMKDKGLSSHGIMQSNSDT